jgi:hypothetical protein
MFSYLVIYGADTSHMHTRLKMPCSLLIDWTFYAVVIGWSCSGSLILQNNL